MNLEALLFYRLFISPRKAVFEFAKVWIFFETTNK